MWNIEAPDEFAKEKKGKDGKCAQCKECKNEGEKNRYHNHGGREKQGFTSMYENKSSAQYIGIVVNERLIKHLFPDAVMMPYGFPGYDFTCNRGKKVNTKASTTHIRENEKSTVVYWVFGIRYNKLCDHFLCVAYSGVENPTPLHTWMIPGKEVNTQSSIQISSSTIHKWNKWKKSIEEAQSCCTAMKIPKEVLQ